MPNYFKLKQGLDIRLKGASIATSVPEDIPAPQTIALKPADFQGLTPKLCVKVDDSVKAGDALFFDKYRPDILFTSPVSGKVKAIQRGDRRKIMEVVVESDGKNESQTFLKKNPLQLTREEICEQLLKSGLWPFIQQRPYGIIANPKDTPKSIFVSFFDSAPLAPDVEYILKNDKVALQTGINVLHKLIDKPIYVGISSKQEKSMFTSLSKNMIVNIFDGPHPAGNVGVQINHVDPIAKGEKVWTVSPQALVYIGRLFDTGSLDMSKVIALSGSEVIEPKYYNTIHGTELCELLKGKTKGKVKERYISGNVLTGTKINTDNYLGFFDNQITVIPEGDEIESFGWIKPGLNKFSASSTFLSKIFHKKEYVLNANMHGDERAYVVTGQFEKLLPMDILPGYLLRAILAKDIDKMEQLGIYEVIEEDLALCEYADTSKTPIQDILRKGINTMINEVG